MRRSRENDLPVPEQVKNIELSEERVGLRVALFVLMAIITLVALGYGVNALLSREPGLHEITAVDTGELSAAADFTFYYHLGAGEESPTTEQKSVKALYSTAATDAFRIFNADMEFEGVRNLYYLNRHVNEAVELEPALYDALLVLQESGARYCFLGPVSEVYFSLFQCETAEEAAQYDPFQSAELRAYYGEAAAFARDDGAIAIELLGNNTARLAVSEEYLRFAEENGTERFVDFGWLRNAFTADYIASRLLEQGYTRGTLLSHDGFVRHLGGAAGEEFSFAASHREGNVVSLAETLRFTFTGAVSLVYLHDYPLGEGDAGNYYIAADGSIRSPFIDPADGLCRSALPELIGYAQDKTCAEIALALAPAYIAQRFDAAAEQSLAAAGIDVHFYR